MEDFWPTHVLQRQLSHEQRRKRAVTELRTAGRLATLQRGVRRAATTDDSRSLTQRHPSAPEWAPALAPQGLAAQLTAGGRRISAQPSIVGRRADPSSIARDIGRGSSAAASTVRTSSSSVAPKVDSRASLDRARRRTPRPAAVGRPPAAGRVMRRLLWLPRSSWSAVARQSLARCWRRRVGRRRS